MHDPKVRLSPDAIDVPSEANREESHSHEERGEPETKPWPIHNGSAARRSAASMVAAATIRRPSADRATQRPTPAKGTTSGLLADPVVSRREARIPLGMATLHPF